MYLFDVRKYKSQWTNFVNEHIPEQESVQMTDTEFNIRLEKELIPFNAVDIPDDGYMIYFMREEDALAFILKFS